VKAQNLFKPVKAVLEAAAVEPDEDGLIKVDAEIETNKADVITA
jgi:hypothetical protein